jgi:carboxyl-terminal processing protease
MSYSTARKIAKVIAILTIVAMIVTSFSFVFFSAVPSVVYAETIGTSQTSDANVDKELTFMKLLMQDIKENYKDSITYRRMIDGAYQGLFESLDPHSVYYPTNDAKADFITAVDGEFVGIGVYLDTSTGECVIVAPLAGTPAEKAGIRPGDVIVEIDGVDVRDLSAEEIASRLTGGIGTKVTIGLERDHNLTVIRYTMIREKIKVTSVTEKMLENSIGYIKIDSFDNDTAIEFTAAKLKLIEQGMKYMIIDLRNNPGGYINQATPIANQLMPAGPIMFYEHQGKIIDTIYADGKGITYIPIAVLINSGSASASEILAGALQDSGAAVLVGTQSYGKGTAQQIVDLTNGAAMKLSEYYFLTPHKTKIDHIGLAPDYVVDNLLGSDEEIQKLIDEAAAFAPMAETDKPKAGDTGLNVYGAQQRLAFLGYDVEPTGFMDAATVTAVKQFQKNSGMFEYGVLDQTTRTKLSDAVTDFIINAAYDGSDPQLKKAIEVVMKK